MTFCSLRFISSILLFCITPFLLCAGCDSGDENSDSSDGDTELASDTDIDGDLDSELVLEQESENEWNKVAPYACMIDPECDQVLVTAHRGYHVHQPENSLAAIRAAAEIGVDFAEIDVRHTQDDILVLMHDGDVDRTTTGTGYVDELSWAQLQDLSLLNCEEGSDESCKIPTFADALALAKQVGIMLYVDQKTDRSDLVAAAITAGPYYEVALVRDGASSLAEVLANDEQIEVMAPLSSIEELEGIRQLLPGIRIVEISAPGPVPELVQQLNQAGLKVQQDVMAAGDILVIGGDYSGWKNFIEAGVFLLQSDFPNLLEPAVRAYNQTGEFPDEGPGAMK